MFYNIFSVNHRAYKSSHNLEVVIPVCICPVWPLTNLLITNGETSRPAKDSLFTEAVSYNTGNGGLEGHSYLTLQLLCSLLCVPMHPLKDGAVAGSHCIPSLPPVSATCPLPWYHVLKESRLTMGVEGEGASYTTLSSTQSFGWSVWNRSQQQSGFVFTTHTPASSTSSSCKLLWIPAIEAVTSA